jgi:hypothetical protein
MYIYIYIYIYILQNTEVYLGEGVELVELVSDTDYAEREREILAYLPQALVH